MSEIHVSVTDQVLKVVKSPVVASGGLNEVSVVFAFCELWNGFEKTAFFYREGEDKIPVILDENDACILPSEVTAETGTFYFFVVGVNGATRRTTTNVKYKVVKGAIISEDYPEAPTKDIYDQIMVMFNETNENKEIMESFVQTIVNEYPDILAKLQELETRIVALEEITKPVVFTIDGETYEVRNGTTWAQAIASGMFGVHECHICQATVTELEIRDDKVWRAENQESCGDCGCEAKGPGGACAICGGNNWVVDWFDGEGIGVSKPLFASNGEHVSDSDVIKNAPYYIDDLSKLPIVTFTLDGVEYKVIEGTTWERAIAKNVFGRVETDCGCEQSAIALANPWEADISAVGAVGFDESCGVCGAPRESALPDGNCDNCYSNYWVKHTESCLNCGNSIGRYVYDGDNQVYGASVIEPKEYTLL